MKVKPTKRNNNYYILYFFYSNVFLTSWKCVYIKAIKVKTTSRSWRLNVYFHSHASDLLKQDLKRIWTFLLQNLKIFYFELCTYHLSLAVHCVTLNFIVYRNIFTAEISYFIYLQSLKLSIWLVLFLSCVMSYVKNNLDIRFYRN